ncbi:MAG: fructose-bisphosphate aldolase class I [Candidatus Nomurabacteria bacterium]|jgi:fructose-bisphosphate aldolase class I|nr:fructose-bisphosphate aldolase class I [Candidatus Nomurabacteria bacterium]
MGSILIVGDITKDVYLRLDDKQNNFERDQNNVNWLDFAFDGSSHRFFSRVGIYGGAAISLEVLARFGVEAEISDAPASLLSGQVIVKYPPSTYRYMLCQDENISYLTPGNPQPSSWRAPNMPPNWIYIDRSAVITAELSQQILTYLDNFSAVRLAVFVSKRCNKEMDFINALIERATLIFADIDMETSRPMFKILPDYIEFSGRRVGWSLEEKKDLMTDLSTRSIIAATVLASVMLGKSAKEALLLARANIETATLNGTLGLKSLEENIIGEEYRIEEVGGKESLHTLELRTNAKKLMSAGKGILAADESGGSIHKKFESMGITDDEQHRRDYRNLFFTTPNLEKYISGVILFDETARQKADDGLDFVTFLKRKGIIPGIKVDQGLQNFDGSPEKYTVGLEGLPDRLKEYYDMGARFAKWRAAFEIKDEMPTDMAIAKNAEILAQYAKDCQDAGIVPIVEPEVVYDGYYTVQQNADVTGKILDKLFEELANKHVDLKSCILKVNMVLAGKQFEQQSSSEEVGKVTATVLRGHVPQNIAGVVFLSGGQGMEQATNNLQAVTNEGPFPWPVTFSFARALQDAALFAWKGNNDNSDEAREAFCKRLSANCDALVKK